MTKVKTKYPLDLTGRNPTNQVGGEKRLLLSRGNTPFRVVSFTYGGFYSRSLKVYDQHFKQLKANIDFIATYTHVDVAGHTGMEVCSAVVILNPALTGYVILSGQLVGGDLAFSLTVEDDVISYLSDLPANENPVWGALVGDYPQWQPGELQEELWERHHYGYLNESLEDIARTIAVGNGVAEEDVREHIRGLYQDFVNSQSTAINQHINDHDHPHKNDKYDVGLGLVENYAVANDAQVIDADRQDLYMTPQGVQVLLDRYAYAPLDTHLNEGPGAHGLTAEQVGAYDSQYVDNVLSQYMYKTDTAANASSFNGYTVMTMYNTLRTEISPGNFTHGMLSPERMGLGTPTRWTTLVKAGEWVDIRDEFNRIYAANDTKIVYLGHLTDDATALNHIRTTLNNIASYPVGTMAIYQVSRQELYNGYNNGDSGWWHVKYNSVAIRSVSGWFTLQ